MAAASDKARFYLEQHIPTLQEFQRKGIFSRDEISAITSKRSDFEHTLNSRGSQPGDYVRYASYEMNLESLRKKRCKRLGVKGSKYNGQKAVFFILERATRQFPGDLKLWMQYIDFCKKEDANKKLAKAFTAILRLHPRDCNLWILAAKHYAEHQGDMGTARSYLQRGLRFCKDDRKLYLEYIKLEMVYLAKLAARRKILGLDETRVEKDSEDDNMIVLPTITAEDINPDISKGIEEVNAGALERLANAPALSGAIPLAIFDAAMKQFRNSSTVAADIFHLIASFADVPAAVKILQQILDRIQATDRSSVEASICDAKLQLFGIDPQSADFPPSLGRALTILRVSFSQVQDKHKARFAESAISLLLPYVATTDEQDDDLLPVLRATVKRYVPYLTTDQNRTIADLIKFDMPGVEHALMEVA